MITITCLILWMPRAASSVRGGIRLIRPAADFGRAKKDPASTPSPRAATAATTTIRFKRSDRNPRRVGGQLTFREVSIAPGGRRSRAECDERRGDRDGPEPRREQGDDADERERHDRRDAHAAGEDANS